MILMRPIILLFFMAFISKVHAGVYLQHSFSYLTTEDDAEGFEYNYMRNQTLLGATVGDYVVLGWNFLYWNKAGKGSSSSEEGDLSLLEMGPRVLIFLNQMKNYYIAFNWNPYVSGERTVGASGTGSTASVASGTTEEITGSSLHFAIGTQFKVTKQFFVGGSINYHSVSIDKATVDSTETDVSYAYTDVYPSIEFSYRFK